HDEACPSRRGLFSLAKGLAALHSVAMPAALRHRWSLSHNYLAGITAGAWWRLLRENRFAVSPAYWHRAAFISVTSLLNTWYAWRERREFGALIAAAKVDPEPVFILGHWRSGTTHLHNLMAQDERFAFANTYQVVNPATFLKTEDVNSKRFAWMVPAKRLMDNMALSFQSPQEEEFAPALLSLRSLYLGMSFPRRMPHYERFLTFDRAEPADEQAWKDAHLEFSKKLSLKYGGRPLLLKSPPNTARVRMLLDLFPRARFVHIHRDPYTVYQSQLKFYDTVLWHTYLQRPDRDRLSDEILARYREVFAALFRDIPAIPAGRFCEVSFTELERQPLATVERIYTELGLGDFSSLRPKLETYVSSLKGYEKNSFPALDEMTRARVREAAAACFERWGYPQ
ncbi:MAG TPA: sulfotransferase, partial [Opitutaceae bacterium]|nr:sulfotransferase [Opitutaceae bacterium]